MERVVNISEYLLSTSSDETLVTYSLGSCLGLSLYDPTVGVAGLLHATMPSCRANAEKAAERPAMYADS